MRVERIRRVGPVEAAGWIVQQSFVRPDKRDRVWMQERKFWLQPRNDDQLGHIGRRHGVPGADSLQHWEVISWGAAVG